MSLTLEQRIHNAYGSQECERLHGIHQYLSIEGRLREEFPFFWAQTDNSTWAYHWGRQVGWREIMYGQFICLGQSQLEFDTTIPKLYPDTAGMEAGLQNFQEYNELNSGVIEVAHDGKSCRAAWLCHGCWYTHFNDNGMRYGANTIERYGSDFIYDESDGHWKYLHEHVVPDGASFPYDSGNWAADSYEKISCWIPEDQREETAYSFVQLAKADPNEPDPPAPPISDAEILHVRYSALMPVQDTAPPPKPYETLDNDNSYSPLDIRPDPDLFVQNEYGQWIPRG